MKKVLRTIVTICIVSLTLTFGVQTKPVQATGIPVVDVAGLVQNTLTAVRMLEQLGVSANQLASLVEQIEQLYELQHLQEVSIEAVTGILNIPHEIKAYFDQFGSDFFGSVMPVEYIDFLESVVNGDAGKIVSILNHWNKRYPPFTREQFDMGTHNERTQKLYEDAQRFTLAATSTQEQTYNDLKGVLASSRKILESDADDIAGKLDKLAMQSHLDMTLRAADIRANVMNAAINAQRMRQEVEARKQFAEDWELSGK